MRSFDTAWGAPHLHLVGVLAEALRGRFAERGGGSACLSFNILYGTRQVQV
jgi:hypothetical protein